MNLRPYKTEEVEINLIPLVDVVLVLLIFFVISTSFTDRSKIDLTLPEASGEITHAEVDKIDVVVDRNGQLFVNGVALVNRQLESVKRALAEARPEGTDPVVIISADARSSHQDVVSVMDAARQVGLYRITFPTNIAPER